MSGDPGDRFFETFTPEVTERLVEALRSAYESACESDLLLSGRGSCEQLFGYTVYQCSKRELTKAVLVDDALRLESEHPLFRLAIGPYVVGSYRVGRFSTEDIERSFPKNRNGAGMMVQDQQMLLPFPEVEDVQDLSDARNVILAHFGNSDDGLVAVYLAIPTKEEGGEIVQWGFTHQVWCEDGFVESSVTPETEQHPVEDEVEPVVRRKERREAK